ncbi:MAG: peptidoglycan bridge formation glycyltransferase FemA/FemB family protein [Treponema sp.]|nr:peptidoglycan bridge formation glycyltransferase FemA/FemB family protein [Treponema sp.]
MTVKRFLQTPFWGEFKANHGWKTLYFAYDRSVDDKCITPLTTEQAVAEQNRTILVVMVRSFSLLKVKHFSLAYIPMAPEHTDGSLSDYSRLLASLSQKLKAFLPKDTLFIRFDPPVETEQLEEIPALQRTLSEHLTLSPVAVQPPDTTVLDLSKTEEELLGGMKNKWRYNVRLAAKKGVQISRHYATDADFEQKFDVFFDLFQQTSERDGVQFHAKDYYKDLLSRSTDEVRITLYLAQHEDDYLAGIITLFCKGEAVYLYGASGNIKRNLMSAYLLQWTAIQDAKAFGCPSYDFYGMPPTDDETHPMHGLYLFKTGFGGAILHRPGSFDVPLLKSYKLYVIAEKLRAWYHKKFLKKLRGR